MLRNPWGIDSDYSADWRDDDTTHWTTANKNTVTEYEEADDGIYFISVEDLTSAYTAYQIGFYKSSFYHHHLE